MVDLCPLPECTAIFTYLRLSVWPQPLIFDYDPVHIQEWAEALLPALGLAATGFALVRRPRLGFLAAWFFIALAPTSSVVPVSLQPIAENRVYLPLMAVAALASLVLARLGRGWRWV